MRCAALIIAIITFLLPGCGGSGSETIVPAKPADFDSSAVAKSALTAFDKNNDGSIDVREAMASPALADLLLVMKSKSLSAADLASRFDLYKTPASCSMPVAVYVTLNDAPVVDAKVTLEPESFFVDILKPAMGSTDAAGRCNEWTVDGKRAIGLSAGLYKIKIEKDGTTTTLGREVLGGGRGQSEVGLRLNLKP